MSQSSRSLALYFVLRVGVTGQCQGDPVALEFPQKWSLHLSQTGHHPTVLTNVCLYEITKTFNEQPAYSLNTSARP